MNALLNKIIAIIALEPFPEAVNCSSNQFTLLSEDVFLPSFHITWSL